MPNTNYMYHKLAMHTTHDHNSQLKMEHFANTNDSSILSDFRMMWVDDKRLFEMTLSTGAGLAGTAIIPVSRGTNSIWLQMSASFVSVSNDTGLMVSM